MPAWASAGEPPPFDCAHGGSAACTPAGGACVDGEAGPACDSVVTLRDPGVKGGDFPVEGITGAKDVAGGADHAVVLRADGGVLSVTAGGATPVALPGKVTAIGAAGSAGFALGEDGVLRRFASGSGAAPSTPSTLEKVVRFAAGDAGLLVELTDGSVSVYGCPRGRPSRARAPWRLAWTTP